MLLVETDQATIEIEINGVCKRVKIVASFGRIASSRF